MKNLERKLIIEQLDRKLKKSAILSEIPTPNAGWIQVIRKALNMSITQFARRLNITPVSAREIEQREVEKRITLKKLSEAAEALDCRLEYVLIPNGYSLEKIVNKRAYELAKEIVLRTSHSMKLEDQGNSEERINKAIIYRAEKIKNEMPRYLWD